MKRKLILGTAFLLIAWSFNSCDLKSCKFCKTVTYENGSITKSGTETEYCGADLITQQATPDVTIGSVTTKVECR
jgi:hypothetical protein